MTMLITLYNVVTLIWATSTPPTSSSSGVLTLEAVLNFRLNCPYLVLPFRS